MKKLGLIVLMSSLLLTGCGRATVKDYTKGYFENAYHADAKALAKVSDYSKKECEELRQTQISNEVKALKESLGTDKELSDEAQEAFEKAVDAAYKKADFEITEAKQTSKGIYSITITCKKANIFKPALNGFYSELSKMTVEDSKNLDYNDNLIILSKQIEKVCEDGPEYDEAKEVKIGIKDDGEKYYMAKSALTTIERALFDITTETETETEDSSSESTETKE